MSINDELDATIEQLERILRDRDTKPGAEPPEISERIRQATKLLSRVEQVLRERKVIP